MHPHGHPPASRPLPPWDLDHILEKGGVRWEDLRGRRLFITGGTGFLGTWMLESLLHANRRLGLGASAVVLTRHAGAFRTACPHLAGDPALTWLEGEVGSFPFPDGRFDLVLHAATTNARETFQGEPPLRKFDTLVQGTRHVLAFAHQRGVQRLLFTSSGVVYGPQPEGLERVPESYAGGPVRGYPQRALAEGKRAAEFLCEALGEAAGLTVSIARCFSFVGPRLPLDIHYAIGNFLRDGLAGGPIVVQGDGRAIRAYQYAADTAAWLWKILLEAESGSIYNVGSDEGLPIADLARLVAGCFPTPPEVRILRSPGTGPVDRYVPSIEKARAELGLECWTSLETAVQRTLAYLGGPGA